MFPKFHLFLNDIIEVYTLFDESKMYNYVNPTTPTQAADR